MFSKFIIKVDKQNYNILSNFKTHKPPHTIRIVMTSRMHNRHSFEMTINAIKSIVQNTLTDFELWLIDNNSKIIFLESINKNFPINIASIRNNIIWQKYKLNFLRGKFYKENGSYNNAVMLELGTKLIHPSSKHMICLHNDIFIYSQNWLRFFINKTNKYDAIGIMTDKLRINALHVSGLLFDFQLFKKYAVSLLPKLLNFYSQKLIYDVGDEVSLTFRKKRKKLFSCKNSYNDKKLIKLIDKDNPFKNYSLDFIFDDDDSLLMLHYGRGNIKSLGNYALKNTQLTIEKWNEICKNILNP